MIKVTLTNEILKRISAIDLNRFSSYIVKQPFAADTGISATPYLKAEQIMRQMTRRTIRVTDRPYDTSLQAEHKRQGAHILQKAKRQGDST